MAPSRPGGPFKAPCLPARPGAPLPLARPTLAEARRATRALRDPARAAATARFFKTGPGEYAEGDRFLGLTVPQVRQLARRFRALPLPAAERLLRSPWHEERALALALMVERHRRGDEEERGRVLRAYLAALDHVDNWDLVDTSAPHILGPHLAGREALLRKMARSPSVWRRRVAVLATQHLIRQGEPGPTLRLARVLLRDEHDLIHKAVGWMLREVHQRDPAAARAFLERHHARMPRTMLRYAVERMPPKERARYVPPRRRA